MGLNLKLNNEYKQEKMKKVDKNVALMKKFFKVRSETDKIMLKLQEWDDFRKKPKKNLAKADDEGWEMWCKIIKMIKAFNRRK